MRDKQLLWWGLLAGGIAIVAALAGYLFFWPNGLDRAGFGPGMMGYGASDYAMMGRGGMMGGYGNIAGPQDSATTPLTVDQAADAARRYLDDFGNSDLKVTQVIEFTNGFYVRVNEQSTGAGALELNVNRSSGTVSAEPGPGQIWNTKYGLSGPAGATYGYGMMGRGYGMMGGYGAFGNPNNTTATTDMPVKGNTAHDDAQEFLDRQIPGAKAGDPVTFYGYYTVEVQKDGRTLGLLSVSGYYGQTWYHSWLGAFLSSRAY